MVPGFVLVLHLGILPIVYGLLEPMPLPRKLSECYEYKSFDVNVTQVPARQIQDFCIRQYLYKEVSSQWRPNITSDGINYINSLMRKIFSEMHDLELSEKAKDTNSKKKRSRRQTSGNGGRYRQEMRTMLPFQWTRFTDSLNRLKSISVEPGTGRSAYDTIAVLHSGSVLAYAHGGPAFLGWHRIYLLLLETACGVSIPYWDSSIDFALEDPTTSVIWSSLYMGNGDGDVVTGPFAHWRTIMNTPLVRNIGSGESSLFTKEGINLVLSRRRLSDITEPKRGIESLYSLEGHHNGPHVWVDGWLARPQTAAYDPVFFLHHAFVDYIYEVFRQQQAWQYGINPQSDYPTDDDVPRGHEWYRLIDFLPFFRPIRNIDALSNYFSRLVTYSPAPECPDCGNSIHMSCDTSRQICVPSVAPELRTDEARSIAVLAAAGAGGVAPAASVPASSRILTASKFSARSRGPLPAGPKFKSSPFRDMRNTNPELPGTQAAMQVAFAGDETRQKAHAAAAAVDPSLLLAVREQGKRRKRSIKEPKPKTHQPKTSIKPYQNTFMLDGVVDVKRWVFISIQILYERPTEQSYKNHLPGVSGNHPDSSFYSDLPHKLKPSKLAPYHKCKETNSSFSRVYVSTDGLNYIGNYKDFVIIDETKAVTSAISYVGIKNPDYGEGEVLITAYDSCGRSCRPACLEVGSNPSKYAPCTGAFKITSLSPRMFHDTYGDAIVGSWNLEKDPNGIVTEEHPPLTFVCDYDNAWPWQHY
ncbi:hypothetical protein FSP39_018034 [Pinctada imbricata]|uniref:Tyrosinase copper-binding domain-containing protein n=1 Tax=Pinctada imbricata TaxID=66713 RepID=A0AA88XLC0_PINIB|nr:hypothetical protein FSP39_018034 [Pinctada imbricata]